MPNRDLTAEQLRKRLTRLERERREEQDDRLLLERLLMGIQSVSGADNGEESFRLMVAAIRDAVAFEDLFILQARPGGALETSVSTSPRFQRYTLSEGPVLDHLHGGEVVAVEDARHHPAWTDQPDAVRRDVASCILVPLSMGSGLAVLVVTHSEGAFFGQEKVEVLSRFLPLMAHALTSILAAEAEAEATELRRGQAAIQALAETSSRMASLLQSMNSAVLVEDEQRRVVLANDAFCETFGIPVPPEELKGADCSAMAEQAADFFQDGEAFTARIERLLDDGVAVQSEELRAVDGRIFLRDFVPIRVGDAGLGQLWHYREITDLRAGEALNRAIVATAMDGIITIDQQGLIVEFNPAAEQMFGHARPDVLGRTMGDVIVPPALRDGHAAGMARYLTSGDPHILGKRIELPALHAKGHEFPIELTVNVIPDSEPPLFTGFIRDITDMKGKEEELHAAKEAAERASAAKSDFLAMMSHEIRTPMNAVLGMTELSLDLAESGEQRGLLRTVHSNAESLLHVINDVLDLSKVEAGQLVIRDEAFSVADLAEGVAEALSSRAFEKGLELSSAVDPTLSKPLVGDANRLRQVLVNLMGNGVKFTDEGHVFLSVDSVVRDDGSSCVRFTVTDTGIGIEEHALERIFEPFYQSDAPSASQRGGTGLGLGISKSIIDAMGGRIWAESTLGEGSTFSFEVPLEASDQTFARRRAADAHYERWQAWVLSPMETTVAAVNRGLGMVGMPCREATVSELEGLLGDTGSDVCHLVVADQRLGLTDLRAVADAARGASTHREVRLAVLVPPGPVSPWQVDGPPATTYVQKPATRRKLCAAFAPGDQEADPLDGTAGQTAVGLSGRILLVEDNEANQLYATRVLERAGYQVELAEDGAIGLRMALEGSYDLIVTDLDMPNMDGIQMTTAIRERQGEDSPPILAFTAHVVEGFRERCLEVGMVGFITKPSRPDGLLREVAKAMGEGPTVLVVDDSPENRELTKRFLATERVRVEVRESGLEAIERIREGGVRAVLLDMNMPELDGYETAGRIRALPHGETLPILAMTSWVGPEEERRCLDAGCTAYLEKPLRRGALIERLAELLRGSTSHQEAQSEGPSETVLVDPAIADLIPEYLADRRGEISHLRDHLRRGDLESIRVLAHNLAGSGEPYGFARLTSLGRALEDVATKGGREDVGKWINEIEAYLGTVTWEVGADL